MGRHWQSQTEKLKGLLARSGDQERVQLTATQMYFRNLRHQGIPGKRRPEFVVPQSLREFLREAGARGGTKGGRARTEVKAEAARANGLKRWRNKLQNNHR
jgi:hypothetical protein